jgi:hypothetical protein
MYRVAPSGVNPDFFGPVIATGPRRFRSTRRVLRSLPRGACPRTRVNPTLASPSFRFASPRLVTGDKGDITRASRTVNTFVALRSSFEVFR